MATDAGHTFTIVRYAALVVVVTACNSPEVRPPRLVVWTHLELSEGTETSLALAVDHPPRADYTVQLVADGAVTVSPPTLTFSKANSDTPQFLRISTSDDLDVIDDTGSVFLVGDDGANETISVVVRDDDVQAIVPSASAVTIGEGMSTTLGVSLAFVPAAGTSVAIATLDPALVTATPSTLTFTPANHDVPQLVTISSRQDANLRDEATELQLSAAEITTEVSVKVVDDDRQQIVLGTSTVTIPEGENRAINVSLAFEPSGPVTVHFSSDNPSIPVFPSSQMHVFSPGDYANPRVITVANAVDRNAIDEIATISVVEPTTNATGMIVAIVDDLLAREYYGWPTNFFNYAQLEPNTLIALQITNVAPYTLDKLGVILSSATSMWRAALYTDAGGAPGTLVVGGPGALEKYGVNELAIAPVVLTGGTYWLALRVSGGTLVNESTGAVTAPTCVRAVAPSTFADPWPTDFGSATCGNVPARNLFVDTRY